MRIRHIIAGALLLISAPLRAQSLPTDGPLTIRPLLQQLGERLLRGKTGAIVAINPENGEIILSEVLGRNAFPERPSLGRYDSNKDKW